MNYNIDLSEELKAEFNGQVMAVSFPHVDIGPDFNKKPGGRISTQEIRVRAGNAMARKLPPFIMVKNDSETWVICGAGPSLKDSLPTVRELQRKGAYVIALNKTHDYLLDHDIKPWAAILLDPMPWVAEYIKRPRMDVRYFVASQCHDDTFEALKGFPVFLWHAAQDTEDGSSEPNRVLMELWPRKPWHCVPGPTTVGLRALFVGAALGPIRPRVFHLVGLDSSREGQKLHAMPKKEAEDAHSGCVTLRYKGFPYKFDTNNHMRKQAEDFDGIIDNMVTYWNRDFLPKDIDIIVHGRGLLPFRAACLGLHANANDDPGSVVPTFFPITAN